MPSIAVTTKDSQKDITQRTRRRRGGGERKIKEKKEERKTRGSSVTL